MLKTLTTIGAALLLLSPVRAQYLILNDQHQFEAVLYEVPNPEDRAEVVRSLEFLRNRFWKNAEIVDVTSLDDAALRQKIKGPFVLYTILNEHSRLLPLVAQPLPLRIENGTLHWRDLAATVDDLRMVFVGKNPYANGNVVVYGAGSPHLLANANAVFHGPCSYHIFQGEKLLREGYYNRNFVEKADRLTVADAAADANQLFSTLERVHPNLLAKVSEEDYQRLKHQTVNGIAARAGHDGKISVRDLEYLLTYAAAYFRDGHTAVYSNPQLLPAEVRDMRFPPFRLAAENGRFFIASRDASVPRQELVAVNGTPAVDFFRPILDRCSGETLTWRATLFVRNEPQWFVFTNLFGTSSAPLKLKLRDDDGAETERAAETVGIAEYMKLPPARTRVWKGTQVEFFDSGRIAHFIYASFQKSAEEKKKIDDIFQQIKDTKSQELVIDLRGNGGGNSEMGDYIFHYFYPGRVDQVSDERIKVSRDVYEMYKKIGVPLPADADRMFARYEGKVASLGELLGTREMQAAAPEKPAAFFSGRTWLLIDNGTFSSGSMFAAAYRDYAMGKIVGYESGGVPIAYGDIMPFTLKNSGIQGGVSHKHFFPPKPRPGDDEHGVLSDIPVSAKLLAPYRNEPDPVLAFTLAQIRR